MAPIIIGKLLNIGGILQKQGNRLLLPFGLNQQQFSIFFEIGLADKVQQKEMVNRLMLERAHVSKVVKKLQQLGLISIDADAADKRTAWLSVTQKGKETLKKCQAVFEEWNSQWMAELDEAQLQAALDQLDALQKVFKQKNP